MKRPLPGQLSFVWDDDVEVIERVPAIISEKTPVALAVDIQIEPVPEKRHLFVLETDMLDTLTGPRAKAWANIEAIEIEAASRGQCSDDEKAKMARYSGWGGLSAVFDENNADYEDIRSRLRLYMSNAHYERAKESVLSAYYTEPEVAAVMWQVVRAMGFEGGSVLEPSCGSGHFVGCMPVDLRHLCEITMVEEDPTTAKLAKAMYGDKHTKVISLGIEYATLRRNGFDVVIGNIPFGNYRVSDRSLDHLKLHITDYFFAKAIELVKPGGIICLLTSIGTLDKASDKFRRYLAERADLVTAIRLPSGAFKRLGGTDVTTDILVFRKKPEVDDERKGANFTSIVEAPTHMKAGHFSGLINSYFVENPTKVLGRLVPKRSRFGDLVGVVAAPQWADDLRAMAKSPDLKGWFAAKSGEREHSIENTGLKSSIASGFFFDERGELYYLDQQGIQAQSSLPINSRLRLEGMTRVRDAAVQLLETESQGQDGANLRHELNWVYDRFIAEFGYLMRPVNRRLFSLDSHAPLVWSLERYDEEKDSAIKSDLFTRSTVSAARLAEKAESVGDAIALSYNRFARLNLDFMAKAMDTTVMAIVSELEAMGRVFMDPSVSDYVDSEAYLSGNVRAKLKAAIKARDVDARFDVNVRALEPIVPADIPLSEVALKLGVPWIGPMDIAAFIKEVVGDHTLTVAHMPTTGSWSISGATRWLEKSASFSSEWGTPSRPVNDLLKLLLNQQSVTVYAEIEGEDGKKKVVVDQHATVAARDKAEGLQRAFVTWVRSDEARVKRLQEVYNDLYNAKVNRVYDGSHLVVPGLSLDVTLRQAQKDSIWRGLVSGNTLYALAVGGGKTLIQIVLAQESKRLGLAAKPLLVVPNHMLFAFASEYKRAFPLAKVLAATKNDLEGDKRRVLLSRIATESWDCILITHSGFGKISIDPQYVEQYARQVGSEISASVAMCDDSNAIREAARQRKTIEAKLKSLGGGNGKRDEGLLTFDQLGVDMIEVDEADLFKSLFVSTKKTRVAGISGTCSQRAFDLFLKSRQVFEKRGDDGFGLVFSTATPISNSIQELFIAQTYLQPKALAALDIGNFDAWAANFASEVTAIEVTPEGKGFRLHTRFSRFENIPELMLLFREVAEIRNKRMLALPEPRIDGGAHTVVVVQPSEDQKMLVESLVERAANIRNGGVPPSVDNMLVVTGDGRKCALDMRILDERYAENPAGKVAACVERVLEHWRLGREQKLTQLVFCDLSVPKKTGFSVYAEIKKKLMAHGVPESDIAFAQDWDTDAKKGELHRKVRTGMIRILIGSTELMGFGTNLQDRLCAEHHLDAPWRPRDVEQRDGRIVRQGNRNETVFIYRYVTSGTFDSYMWQGLERKAGFIEQVMSGETSARTVEDVTSTALSYSEVKALATGNPIILAKAGVDAQVSKLLTLKQQFELGRRVLASKLSNLRVSLDYRSTRLQNAAADIAQSGDTRRLNIGEQSGSSSVELCRTLMTHVATIKATALTKSFLRISDNYDCFAVGAFKFEVYFEGDHKSSIARYEAIGPSGQRYDMRLPYGAEALDEFFRTDGLMLALKQYVSDTAEKLALDERELVSAQRQLASPFVYETELLAALQEQERIDNSLGVYESAVETDDEVNDETSDDAQDLCEETQ